MGIEIVLLTRRSNALATSAIAPLIATRTSGLRRRSLHESVAHFHTTRLCVSWAKPQESGCKPATWQRNLVFPPEKASARVTNSGWKFSESFRKPANTTVALYLACSPITRFPPAGLLPLLRILMLVTIFQQVRGARVAGHELCAAPASAWACGAHDVRSMEGVLEGLELVGRRAARRANLVPKVGSAVNLVTAGSGTGSGNEV